jgi:uncharacterized protein (DUF1778 family)
MTIKDARREVRLAKDDDDLLVEAAGLSGVSVSEFVLGHAVTEAQRIVQANHEITFTSPELKERFFAVLDAPFVPNKTLAGQISKARRYKTKD